MTTNTIYARIPAELRTELDAYVEQTGKTLANAVSDLLLAALRTKRAPQFYGPPDTVQVCALCASWAFRNAALPFQTVIHHQQIHTMEQLVEAVAQGMLLRDGSGYTFDPRPVTNLMGTPLCAAHIGDAYDMVFLKQRRL